jgi:hypothetical protein
MWWCPVEENKNELDPDLKQHQARSAADKTTHSLASTPRTDMRLVSRCRDRTACSQSTLLTSSTNQLIHACLSALQANCIFGPFRSCVAWSQRDSTTPRWTRQPKQFESVRHLPRCHCHCWQSSHLVGFVDILLTACSLMALSRLRFLSSSLLRLGSLATCSWIPFNSSRVGANAWCWLRVASCFLLLVPPPSSEFLCLESRKCRSNRGESQHAKVMPAREAWHSRLIQLFHPTLNSSDEGGLTPPIAKSRTAHL